MAEEPDFIVGRKYLRNDGHWAEYHGIEPDGTYLLFGACEGDKEKKVSSLTWYNESVYHKTGFRAWRYRKEGTFLSHRTEESILSIKYPPVWIDTEGFSTNGFYENQTKEDELKDIWTL